MSANLIFDDVQKEVKDFDETLARLTKHLEKLDKTGVNHIEQELKRLSKTANKSLQEVAVEAALSAEKLTKAFGGGKLDVNMFDAIKKATKDVQTAIKSLYGELAVQQRAYGDNLRKLEAAQLRLSAAVAATTAKEQAALATNTANLLKERAAAADLAASAQARLTAAVAATLTKEQAALAANTANLLKERAAAAELAASAQARLTAAVAATLSKDQVALATNTANLLKERAAAADLAAAAQTRLAAAVATTASKEAAAHAANTANLLKERAAAADLASAAANKAIAKAKAFAPEAQVTGTYQQYDPTTGAIGAVMNKNTESANAFSRALKLLTINGLDAHSMVRGLASGFNLLWLTWGATAPLLAGAAISMSFVGALKAGTAVAENLADIRELTGATTPEIGELNKVISDMAQATAYGPTKTTEALKTLMLAGLGVQDAMRGIKPTLDFAMTGGVDTAAAAETLVAVTTAFGYSADKMSVVGDVIAKTAAVSMSSVDSMSQSFKVASVVAQQFNVSLDDAALNLALLAQIGIKGQAAGTSMRNFYQYLISGSGPAKKALADLGVTVLDTATNSVKPYVEVIGELDIALRKLKPQAQQDAMSKMQTERGNKDLAASLVAYRTKMDDLNPAMTKQIAQLRAQGKEQEAVNLEIARGTTLMANMQKQISDAPGFTAIAAAGKNLSPGSQWSGIKASMENDLNDAFKASQDLLYVVAAQFRELLNSPEFKAGVASTVSLVSQIIEKLVDFSAWITRVGSAFSDAWPSIKTTGEVVAASTVAFMAAQAVIGPSAIGIGVLGTAYAALKTEVTATTIATRASTLALAASPAFWVAATVAVVAAGAAYLYLRDTTTEAEKALKKQEEQNAVTAKANEARNKDFLASIDAAIQGYKDRAQAANEMKGIEQIQAENSLAAHKDRLHQIYEVTNAELMSRKKIAEADLAVAEENTTESVYAKRAIASISSLQVAALQQYVDGANKATSKVKELSDLAKAEAEAAKAQRKSAPFGTEDSPASSGSRGSWGSRYQAQKLDNDNTLASILATYGKQKAAAQELSNDEIAILDAKHKAQLMTESEYQSSLLSLEMQFAEKESARIDQVSKEYRSEYEQRQKLALDLIIKAANTPVSGEAGEAARRDNLQKLAQEYENLNNTATTTFETLSGDKAKLSSKIIKTLTVAAYDAQKAMVELDKADKAYWKKDADDLSKTRSVSALDKLYANVNDSVFSLAKAEEASTRASNTALEDHKAYVAGLQAEYAKVLATVSDYQKVVDNSTNPEAKAAAETTLGAFQGTAAKLEKMIADAGTKGFQSAADRGSEAFNAMREKQIKALGDSLSETVMTALFEGGAAGIVSLRALMIAEFKKPINVAIQAVTQPIAGAISSGISGSSVLGGISSMSTMVGEGMAASMSQGLIAGFSTNMTGIASALETSMFSTAAGMAIPYIGAVGGAFAVLDSLGVFGGKFTSATDSGRAQVDYSASGKGSASYNTTGSAEQIALARTNTDTLAQTYFDTAKSLGIKAVASIFGVGFNTGREGVNPQTVLSANVGNVGYSSGEVSSGDSAGLKLAASRAVLTALKASDMPKYLANVFDSLTASSATQDQIDAALNFASSLKTVRDGLLETRTTTQILADNIKSSSVDLGTSATTFKTDFVKAIDAGLSEAQLDKWKTLGTYLDEATAAADALAKTNQSWQDKLDILLGKQTEHSIALRDATDESTRALMRQVFAQEDLKTAAEAAAEKWQDAMDAVTRAVNAEKTRVTAVRDAAKEQVDAAKAVFDTLASSIKSLYGEVTSTSASQAAAGVSFIDKALAAAQSSGYLPDNTALSDAISAATTGIGNQFYATQAEADAARLILAGKLSQLQEVSSTQLTTAQIALDIAEKQLESLDKQLEFAQLQLDAANGVNTSVLSVADAILALTDLLAGATTDGTGTSTTGTKNPQDGQSRYTPGSPTSQGYSTVRSGAKYDRFTKVAGVGTIGLPITDTAEIEKLDSIATTLASFSWAPGDAAASARAIASSGIGTLQEIADAAGYTYQDIAALFAAAGIPAFATGASFSNGIVSKPTMFPMGLMGEKNPEAIMPLVNVGGSLGVRSSGSDSSAVTELVGALTEKIGKLEKLLETANGFNQRSADALEGVQAKPFLVEIAT